MIKMTDVYLRESDRVPAVLLGNAEAEYTLTDLTLEMANPNSALDRSEILEALKVLAGFEAQKAKKEEKLQKVREAEEKRLKAQAAVINPVREALAPISDLLIDGLPEELLMQFDFRISFRTGRFSIDIDSGIDKEDLDRYAEEIGNGSIGFEYRDGALVPSVKAAGTRAEGAPVLMDGLWEVKSSGFRFVTKGGRIYVDGEVIPGKDFLLTYTEETGNESNPDRPFSHPAKTVAAVSRWISDGFPDVAVEAEAPLPEGWSREAEGAEGAEEGAEGSQEGAEEGAEGEA